MRFIDKKFIIGFAIGFLCFPVLFFGGAYLYFKLDMAGFNLTPPKIVPVEQTISLDWDVKTLSGEAVNLKEAFQGKPVFLNFWATWCPPCKKEMPSIESLYNKYKEKVGFACISNESIKDLQKFRDAKGYTMPIYHLEGNPPEALEVKGIPLTYVISKDRMTLFKHYGGADWAHADVIAYFEDMLDLKQ